MSSAPHVPLPLSASSGKVDFSGDRGEFFDLVLRGVRLELVTFGFYRFWLATDIRRHLWSYTSVDGDAAEYTGTSRELLIGFLFAVTILVPIYLAYFLIGIEAESHKQLSSSPLLVLVYAFGHFAVYRARCYRLTRTVWRGVRFWMDGSAVAYAAIATFWSLLTVLTLGLALPWREATLERYKMKHSYYGDLQGKFEGTGWEFFKRGWWLWLLVILPLILFVTVAARNWPAQTKIPNFIILPLLLAALFLYAVFKAIQWRWWISGMRFGDVRLESSLMRKALLGLYGRVMGWFLLFFTLLYAYLSFCTQVLTAAMGQVAFFRITAVGKFQGSVSLFILVGLGCLAFVLVMSVVARVYLVRDVWVRVLSSTEIYNIDAATDVSVKGELANALGEGFADSMDVVGF
jgi:uncharacterized membrane protein YjgN (DUF898 family)